MAIASIGEMIQPIRVPIWRLIFDQGYVSQAVLNHSYNGSGTDEDPYQVFWLDHDPRDPMGFSVPSKWFIMAPCGLCYASGGVGSLNEVILDFQVSEEVALLGISFFVVGFSVGPLIWAPLSELYGRRPIMIASATGLTAFTAGATGSKKYLNFSYPPFLRRGIGISAFCCVRRNHRGYFPCHHPRHSQWVSAGWRWVEGLVAAFAGVLGILTILTLPETYAPVLLRKRAERLSAMTGHVYRSMLDIEKGRASPATVFKTALCLPWILLFRGPIVLLFSANISIIFYLLFAAIPIVYEGNRGWSEGLSGLAFLGILVGIIISVVATFPRYFRYKKKTLCTPGRVPPEERLFDALIGAVALPVGLFLFCVHWMASIAAGVPFGFGMVMVFLPVLNYLLDAYTIYAASVMAAKGSLRSIFGAAFPLFTKPMYDNLGIHWASSIPAFLALACVPMPFLFYKYGAVIRKKRIMLHNRMPLWKR
ncbi:uncharacterized protein N7483_006699 [Penicillium malachiteum]|uniref:uncharacterized protein n=1 Tax=Penicillium malachiteum TaxID=1324776 RepID=UPI00254710E0|nr:uncharacterized protein N7483_006699 [Penicillium malachiteum]KAJ5725342.1 hypothetical protein N7483_006699 [Penicillium malachiteum]